MSLGESRDVMSEISRIHKPLANENHHVDGVCIVSINIQRLLFRKAELEAYLSVHRPHIVLLQETWLDETVFNVDLLGYQLVSRRDRKLNANRGGIITFQRDDFNVLILIKN